MYDGELHGGLTLIKPGSGQVSLVEDTEAQAGEGGGARNGRDAPYGAATALRPQPGAKRARGTGAPRTPPLAATAARAPPRRAAGRSGRE